MRNYRVTINRSHIKVQARSPHAAALIAVGETISDVDAAIGTLDVSCDVIVMNLDNKSEQKVALHVSCARKGSSDVDL